MVNVPEEKQKKGTEESVSVRLLAVAASGAIVRGVANNDLSLIYSVRSKGDLPLRSTIAEYEGLRKIRDAQSALMEPPGLHLNA